MFFAKKNKETKKRGACSLVFDDAYKETLVNVLPILKKYNLRATFAFATNPEAIEKTEKFPCASLEIAKKIRSLGHEIASHSVNHKNLTQISDTELQTELENSQKTLRAETIIYPGGKYDDRVLTQAKKYYQFGRSVAENLNHIPPQNFLTLQSYVLRQNTKWLILEHKAKQAAKKNLWLVESYHLVSDKEKNYRFTAAPRDFEKHLQKLIKLNLWIAPLAVIGKYIENKTSTPARRRS